MEFVKLAIYIVMFIISMVQVTRSKKNQPADADTPAPPSPPEATPSRADSMQTQSRPQSTARRTNSGRKPRRTNGAPRRRPARHSQQASRTTGQQNTAAPRQTHGAAAATAAAATATATVDSSQTVTSQPIPAFAAFTGFPLLAGLAGGCGSWLFHGQQATAVGVMAGGATGFFAAMMYTLYHATNQADWQPASEQQRPVSLFAARAVPGGAAAGTFLGWMIPARGETDVYFAPFVLMLFGALAAVFISMLHEAAQRRQARS